MTRLLRLIQHNIHILRFDTRSTEQGQSSLLYMYMQRTSIISLQAYFHNLTAVAPIALGLVLRRLDKASLWLLVDIS